VRPPSPPGPSFFATLGALPRDPLGFFTEVSRTHGDVARIPLAHRSFVLVTHPDGFQRVLVDNARNYDKRTPTFAKIRGILGEGLLTSDGDEWLRRRRIVQPAFHKDGAATLLPVVAAATRAMLDRWCSRSDPGPIDVGDEMSRLTLEIAVRALLDGNLGDEAEVARAAADAIAHTNRRIESWLDLPLGLPTPGNLRFRRARRSLDRIVSRLLAAPSVGAGMLLERLRLACVSTDVEQGRRLLRDEMVTMIMAGHETTANVLTWALDAAGRRPDVSRQLLAESMTIPTEQPGLEDIDRLTYTASVLREVMRLYPPAWILERRALGDDVVGGYRIPRGTTIALCPYVLHRRADSWSDPESFEPERFAGGRTPPSRFAYVPFGAGARQCIGGRFAMVEAALIVAMIHRAVVLRPESDAAIAPRPGVTLRPSRPVKMTCAPHVLP
jgi:cytochrome P450